MFYFKINSCLSLNMNKFGSGKNTVILQYFYDQKMAGVFVIQKRLKYPEIKNKALGLLKKRKQVIS